MAGGSPYQVGLQYGQGLMRETRAVCVRLHFIFVLLLGFETAS